MSGHWMRTSYIAGQATWEMCPATQPTSITQNLWAPLDSKVHAGKLGHKHDKITIEWKWNAGSKQFTKKLVFDLDDDYRITLE